MKLEVLAGPAQVAERAADLVEDWAGRSASRSPARLALPAGRTPVALYAELVRRARAGGAGSIASAHLFQLDEVVGAAPESEESFQHFLREHLIDPLRAAAGRPPERDHLLDGSAADPAAEIERHAGALEALGGLDVALLGLGPNGHVAFNEPGSRAGDPARVVELAGTSHAAELGITLGLRELLAARRVALLVTGHAKADILARVLGSDPDPACPATFLHNHPEVRVLADAEAAGRPA